MFSDLNEISDAETIIAAIQKSRNPLGMKPLDLIDSWQEGDLQRCQKFIAVHNEFYLLYEHPVHKFKNKLFKISQEQCLKFIKDSIRPDEGTGIDVTLSSLDFKSAIVFNHDGHIFIVSYDD